MILDDFTLQGKVALITGSNRGLGAAVAAAFAQAGAKVLGVSTKDSNETRQKIESAGGVYIHVSADLSQISSVQTIINSAVREFGNIDILVNNAGIIRRNDSLTFTEKDWDDVLNVNLKSAFFLSQAVAKHLVQKEKGGKIINIASLLSFQGGIRIPSYTASKSGIMGLTRLLACEWARYNINVNAIAPGYMITDNTEALRNDSLRNQEITNRIPAGRWGEPQDLGGAAVFLASKASDYVHGFTLAVDGGWLAR